MNSKTQPAETRHKYRDYRLDCLRGFACVIMFFAHAIPFGKEDPVAVSVNFYSGLAPVVFFGLVGVLVRQRVAYYSLGGILLLYAFVFIFGLNYNTVLLPFAGQYDLMEIFQIIAVGAMAVAVVERVVGPNDGDYLVIAIFLLSLNYVFMTFWPQLNLHGTLRPNDAYIPFDQLAPGDKKEFPGFPILTWLYVFFLGPGLWGQTKTGLLIIAITSLLTLWLLEWAGFQTHWHDKWSMTPGYACLCIAFFSLAVWLTKSVSIQEFSERAATRPWSWLVFFGTHSLLFIVCHAIGLVAYILAHKIGQYTAWLIGLIVTYWSMQGVLRLPQSKLFRKPAVWYGLAGVSILLTVIVNLYADAYLLVAPVAYILWLLFAKHLDLLSGIVKLAKRVGREK